MRQVSQRARVTERKLVRGGFKINIKELKERKKKSPMTEK